MRVRFFQNSSLLGVGLIAGIFSAYKMNRSEVETQVQAKPNQVRNRPIDHSEYLRLIAESDDLKIEPVSQSKFKNREGYNGGICFGLSASHIISQLNSKSGPVNPFRAFYTVDVGFLLQNKPHIPHSFLANNKLFVTKVGNNPDLEHELKKTIQSTAVDGKGRGALVVGQSHRFSTQDEPVGHAITMTAQKINGKLMCTGLDVNIFFAKGSGINGCYEVAKRIKTATEIYDFQNDVVIYNLKKLY